MSAAFPAAGLRRRRHLLALALASAWPAARAQVTVEGYTYAATIELGGRTLQLNGVGLRAVAWFKGYAAGLYLGPRASSAEAVLADAGPKRLRMRMFVDVPTVEFVKAFYKGIARNTPAAQQPGLATRMQRFDLLVNSLGEVKKNDIVDLDYLPGEGLLFSYNGRSVGQPLAGADFYDALLRIFIGGRPVDKEMKIGLLGGPVG
jgi:hypothetical protein